MGSPNEPLTGFSWKAGSQAHTRGILLWSDVFLYEKIDEKYAIVLMDTQGLFELERIPSIDAKIFGISSFLSSIQILNLNDVIQENELEYLKMVTDYTKITMKRQNKTTMNTLSKPFQKLLLLVRDWTDEDVGFGYEGGVTYLNTVLNINSENTDAQAVRNNIKISYENVDAFLLPSPGKIRSKNYNGSLSGLDSEFKEHLKIVIENLLSPENLVAKKIFDKEVTGNDLIDYAIEIFLAYQSSDLPEIDSIFNIAVKNEMKKLSDIVYEKYTLNITSSKYYEEKNFVEKLSNDHEAYQKLAVDEFMQLPKLGDNTTEIMFKNSLINKTDEFFSKWKPQAIKTHFEVLENKIDKLKAINDMKEQYDKILEQEKMLADLRRNAEVNEEKINFLNSSNYRRGLVLCKIFSLGLGSCGKM